MLLGASSPATRSRPRLVDLNLVPPEFRRRPLPLLTTGLSLLTLGSVLLLYVIFYAKTYSDLEVSRLSTRVSQARTVVQTATGDPASLAEREKLRAMRDDYQVLAERQIHWGDVYQTIGDVPPGVILKSASQAGFGVTVDGSAINSAAAASYVDQLRNSGLFVNASIQMRPASGPVVFATPTVVPSPPGPPTGATPPRAPLVGPPTPVRAPPTPYPTPRSRSAASPSTPSATPTITRTRTPTATSTPAYDFVLVSSQQLPASNPYAGTSDIRGTVLDKDGKAFPGVVLQIDSEGSPPWSATKTTDQDGSFDFAVTHGKFKVYPLSGRPQPAVDLYTGADGVPGVYNYQLVFKATFTGSIPPTVVGTATATPTSTIVPTWTPTPISPGANVASLGCASAYVAQTGGAPSPLNSSTAGLAIDGNLGTEWNAGIAPSSGTQILWQWILPAPGQAPAGCAAAGLPDYQDLIEGIQLIPDQSQSGYTQHELWLYSDPNCSVNASQSGGAYYTWQQTTSAGTVLSLRLASPTTVRCVIVRTLTDPSNVAWEEIQIYQTLPPPNGFPTFTATTTPVGPTPTATATATVTPTVTHTPTLTFTATPTLTPLMNYYGVNVAPNNPVAVGAIVAGSPTPTPCKKGTSSGPTDPCSAIDGTPTTYWAPTPGTHDPQDLTILLLTPASIQDVRVVVRSAGTPEQEQYQVYLNRTTTYPNCQFDSPLSGFPDSTELECAVPTPLPGGPTPAVVSVTVRMASGAPADGNYGIREIRAYVPYPTPGTQFASRFGLGQGPGGGFAAAPTPISTASPSSTTPVAPTTGPVDFTIILEVASGKGYP